MSTHSKQLGALSFCAATVPSVLFLPQVGIFAGIAVAVIAILFCIASKFPMLHARWALNSLLVWKFIALGATADAICAAFPDGNALIGILLLLLAAYAAGKNRVLSVGAVALFILFTIYSLLIGFSIPQMQWQIGSQNWQVMTTAFTPMLCLYLRKEQECPKLWLLGLILLTVLVAAATGTADSFYTAMKSISILGAMERLEPLVSVALTIGGFCLLGMICTVNETIISKLFARKKNCTDFANFFLGGIGIYLSRVLGSTVLAIGTAIFWGLIPLLPLLVEIGKKLRKNEKNA